MIGPATDPSHEQRSRFAFFDEIPEGVCILSENGLVVFWNRRLAAWTGVAPARICGVDIRERFPAVADGEVVEALGRVFDEGGEVELPPAFGRALLPPVADRRLRSRATPLSGLDVCRYVVLLVQEDAGPALSAPPPRERDLEAQLFELARELELERARGERLAAELAKALEQAPVGEPADEDPAPRDAEFESLLARR